MRGNVKICVGVMEKRKEEGGGKIEENSDIANSRMPFDPRQNERIKRKDDGKYDIDVK
jgi:hypothetical protein